MPSVVALGPRTHVVHRCFLSFWHVAVIMDSAGLISRSVLLWLHASDKDARLQACTTVCQALSFRRAGVGAGMMGGALGAAPPPPTIRMHACTCGSAAWPCSTCHDVPMLLLAPTGGPSQSLSAHQIGRG